MWPIAEITLYHRYFSFKLNYPISGPRLLQYLCPSGYKTLEYCPTRYLTLWLFTLGRVAVQIVILLIKCWIFAVLPQKHNGDVIVWMIYALFYELIMLALSFPVVVY